MIQHQESGTGTKETGSRTQNCSLGVFFPLECAGFVTLLEAAKQYYSETVYQIHHTAHNNTMFKENITVGTFDMCLWWWLSLFLSFCLQRLYFLMCQFSLNFFFLNNNCGLQSYGERIKSNAHHMCSTQMSTFS